MNTLLLTAIFLTLFYIAGIFKVVGIFLKRLQRLFRPLETKDFDDEFEVFLNTLALEDRDLVDSETFDMTASWRTGCRNDIALFHKIKAGGHERPETAITTLTTLRKDRVDALKTLIQKR